MAAAGRRLRRMAGVRLANRGEAMTAVTSESSATRLLAAIRGCGRPSLRGLAIYSSCGSLTTARRLDAVGGRGRGDCVTISIRLAFRSRESASRGRVETEHRSKAGRLLIPLLVGITAVSTASRVAGAHGRSSCAVAVSDACESGRASARQSGGP